MILLKNVHDSTEMHQRGRFVIEDSISFQGFKNGNYWNGWECPVFTKEVSEKILNRFMRKQDEAFYDKEKDAFIVRFFECKDEEPEVFEGTDIVVGGQTYHVYGIGSFSWCWDEVK